MFIKRFFLIPLTIIIASLYLFPFICSYFPIMNTKMALAGISLVILAFVMANGRSGSIDSHLSTASLYAGVVSFIGFISVVYNSSFDYTYASYIMSMWVWLGAAYVLIQLIRGIHGKCSALYVCNYLIAVCVTQCIIALMVDSMPAVKSFVDGFVVGEGFMGTSKDRMYGIGASLDVAGMKFAGVLIMIAVILKKIQDTKWQKYQLWYILAFAIISVIGPMIGRTTYIGAGLSILYWLYIGRRRMNFNSSVMRWGMTVLLSGILIVIYFYNSSPAFKENIRFGFEGFFSLVEKGHWETNSNNRLASMVVWPKETKTWIIGDGYFNNPLSTNPYYVGDGIGAFYKNTDIGYCRFIFYFGTTGLLAFMVYFFRICQLCIKRLGEFKAIFILILLANYIIWGKVASDLFVLFAPFFIITLDENKKHLEEIGYKFEA